MLQFYCGIEFQRKYMLYFSVTVLATTHAQHGTEECFFCMLVAKYVKESKNKASALCELHVNSVGARAFFNAP